MASLLELVDLARYYQMGDQRIAALAGVSFSVERGEMVAIVGTSGSGKSTLLNLLGCLDTPSAGVYRLAGKDVQAMSDDERAHVRNRQIGFVFQSFQLLHRASAQKNVALPLVYRGLPGRERDRLAAEALARRGQHDPDRHARTVDRGALSARDPHRRRQGPRRRAGRGGRVPRHRAQGERRMTRARVLVLLFGLGCGAHARRAAIAPAAARTAVVTQGQIAPRVVLTGPHGDEPTRSFAHDIASHVSHVSPPKTVHAGAATGRARCYTSSSRGSPRPSVKSLSCDPRRCLSSCARFVPARTRPRPGLPGRAARRTSASSRCAPRR